jgi:VWFA-related protein
VRARWISHFCLPTLLLVVPRLSCGLQSDSVAGSAQVLPGPVVRVNTRLVLVDVVVAGKKNHEPVTGLKSDDFTVLEKGKPQKIAFFTSPDRLKKASPADALPPGTYSNRPQYRSPGGAPTLIVLDAVNTPPQNQVYARDQLFKFVKEQYTRGEPVAVLALATKFIILQDFTSDPQLLVQAIQQYRTQEPPGTRDPAAPAIQQRPHSQLLHEQAAHSRQSAG